MDGVYTDDFVTVTQEAGRTHRANVTHTKNANFHMALFSGSEMEALAL